MITGEKLHGVEDIKNRVFDTLGHGKQKATELGHTVAEKSRKMASLTDGCVHNHPWQAVLASAAFGLIIGMLLKRS